MTTLEELKKSLSTAQAASTEARAQQAQASADPSHPEKRVAADARVKETAERLSGLETELAAAKAAEAKAAEAAARAQWKRHTVAAGETLSHVSLHYYKTANRWKEIYEANKDVIGENPNVIKPGQVLAIPDTQA